MPLGSCVPGSARLALPWLLQGSPSLLPGSPQLSPGLPRRGSFLVPPVHSPGSLGTWLTISVTPTISGQTLTPGTSQNLLPPDHGQRQAGVHCP